MKKFELFWLLLIVMVLSFCITVCGCSKKTSAQSQLSNNSTQHSNSIGEVVSQSNNNYSEQPIKPETNKLEFNLNSDKVSYSVSGIGTATDEDIVIPSQYKGKPVTSIESFAFENCRTITSVTIPNSVTDIKGYAFSGCKLLSKLDIGNGITNIENYAFENCKLLKSITFSNNLTEIEDKVFIGCENITDITAPINVIEAIPKQSLKNVIVTGGSRIASNTFDVCNSLESITIPDSVNTIDCWAFYNCSSLKSITLPFVGGSKTANNGYDQVFGYIFGYFKNPSEYYTTNATCQYYDGSDFYYYYIPASLKTVVITGGAKIVEWAFFDCKSIQSITIPNSVTSIGDKVFSGCNSLESVTIPNSVTSIGDYTFRDCISLESVTIPNSVTSIGDYAFEFCSSLQSITIPDSVTSIGDYAFEFCSSLQSITIPDSVTSIGENAFSYCKTLKSATIGNNVTSIGDYAFRDCISLESVTIPNSVTSIGYNAFNSCDSLLNASFENSNGWWLSSSSTSGTIIPAADLANNATAAIYLRKYCYYTWQRS